MSETTVDVIALPGDEVVESYEATFLPRKDEVLFLRGDYYTVENAEHIVVDVNGRGLKPAGVILYVRPAPHLAKVYHDE